MTDKFKNLRDQIDAIDNEILQLVNNRAKFAQEIGHLKKQTVVYRPEREAQVLARLKHLNTGPLADEQITFLFTEIMSLCRAMEQPMSVACLGPSGSFSEEAALKRFGCTIMVLACDSIDEVFRKVEAGIAGYGVVPAENSTEGTIGRTMDLLLQTSLTVCGEIRLPVHQCLIAQQTKTSAIDKIYSHPQSFSQCHEWLNKICPICLMKNALTPQVMQRRLNWLQPIKIPQPLPANAQLMSLTLKSALKILKMTPKIPLVFCYLGCKR